MGSVYHCGLPIDSRLPLGGAVLNLESVRLSTIDPSSCSGPYNIYFMAALCNRAGHYIFALWFLSSFISLFSSPNLSGRRLDVYHAAPGVALVRIQNADLKCAACGSLETQDAK